MLLYLTVIACADPESFARGGATMTMNIKLKALKAGHHRPARETPFNWIFGGGPMMAQR